MIAIDGLIEGDPDNQTLLLAGSRLYGAYASAFVVEEQVGEDDVATEPEHLRTTEVYDGPQRASDGELSAAQSRLGMQGSYLVQVEARRETRFTSGQPGQTSTGLCETIGPILAP